MAVVGMGINICLNLILIPHFRALGSAWASLATQLFTAMAQTILAVIILKLTINYRIIGKLILFISFVFLAGYLSRQINTWYLGYGIMIISSILFAFITRLINLKALIQIVRNE
jgi:O-antigen/teichoic acid export membrane protein